MPERLHFALEYVNTRITKKNCTPKFAFIGSVETYLAYLSGIKLRSCHLSWNPLCWSKSIDDECNTQYTIERFEDLDDHLGKKWHLWVVNDASDFSYIMWPDLRKPGILSKCAYGAMRVYSTSGQKLSKFSLSYSCQRTFLLTSLLSPTEGKRRLPRRNKPLFWPT